MVGVTAYPVGYAIYLSLLRYILALPHAIKFIGLANYGAVLSSPFWWQALQGDRDHHGLLGQHQLVLGMLLALLMHRTLFGRGTVRTAVAHPVRDRDRGRRLTAGSTPGRPGTGLPLRAVQQLRPADPEYKALAVIILAEIWKTTPFMALLLLAGLSLVPEDLQKAGKVDGATAWQRFTKITLPLMKPAILVALLFRTLDSFRIFDNIFILTAGAITTGSVSILGYDNLFNGLNFGIGSAISILILICVAIIAFAVHQGLRHGRSWNNLRIRATDGSEWRLVTTTPGRSSAGARRTLSPSRWP